ncbi:MULTISPECIES: hypothetical protein [Enterobacter]|uniref:hypothetical protein n=1 Tax=Enterobacter TaxID=547 RepID=UPI0028E64CDE|nr:hypothetical protein [Enterobacter cloacae]WNT38529.1 hypothetical protein RRL13_10645 [Enterobacter cloacae]HDR2796285.1 hypothetical protein [Enterobacter asburiae]HDR2801707.1 hypothetical protein [Enterobacter asburiae]
MERNGGEELGAFNLSISGYNKEEDARKVGDNVGEVIRALSKFIDLSYLDGVTISYFYENALLTLDRGIETDTKLQPSSGDVVGVAMTPMVLRNGAVKSHIVLNAAFIEGILDDDFRGDSFQQALAIIAHECGHVSNCGALDRSFPGRALNHRYTDVHENLRGECWLSVIEEYCATRITGTIGFDNNKLYEETFIGFAEKLHSNILNAKMEFRFHHNVDKVLNEVYELITTALKLAAYYLGDCEAKGIDYASSDFLKRKNILWLHSYIESLNKTCLEIFDGYGKWMSTSEMELISDVLDNIAKDCGIVIRKVGEGFWVDVL